jgi:hypothetical protein
MTEPTARLRVIIAFRRYPALFRCPSAITAAGLRTLAAGGIHCAAPFFQ